MYKIHFNIVCRFRRLSILSRSRRSLPSYFLIRNACVTENSDQSQTLDVTQNHVGGECKSARIRVPYPYYSENLI